MCEPESEPEPGISTEQELRWTSEAEYFDNAAYDRTPLHPVVLERYRNCTRPHLVDDFIFHRMGDLTSRRVLDAGCGDGWRSVIMALKGASVVALDLSPRALAAARDRASHHGVLDRIEFILTPIERYHTDLGFDLITGFSLLHHMLPVLGPLLSHLKRLANRGAEFEFLEPVAISRLLRRVRLALPIPLTGTAGERPLQATDLTIIESAFRRVDYRYFGATTRLTRAFLPQGNFELARPWRRRVYDCSARLDDILLHRLNLRRLASVVVINAQE